MEVLVHPSASAASAAAAELLSSWLIAPETRNLLVAGGNSPLDLYARVARLELPLRHLRVYMLDEYVGVPADESRNCANLLRHAVIKAWNIPERNYFVISSSEADALESIRTHERNIAENGGLDVVILGLGQNGHLGFNEPGSEAGSVARLVPLQPISVEANRLWFGGRFAPSTGVTLGLKTLLAARRILVLAFGAHKQSAVHDMVEGRVGPQCPASFLQDHPATSLFLDRTAAAGLRRPT